MRMIWDWLSWRKDVLRMRKGHDKIKIVMWYQEWNRSEHYNEREAIQKGLEHYGWWKPSTVWW